MDLIGSLVAALDVSDLREMGGGYQSRVFRAVDRHGAALVAKVLDASMVDRTDLDARVAVTAALADIDGRICRPLSMNGRTITELTTADGRRRYVVCIEYATGRAPDPADATDATRMGATLAQLHVSMRQLPAAPLPVVAALRNVPPGDLPVAPHQLLHGDFSTGNLREAGGVVRIFDLDDCGYGPTAFDVANSLYMVLFDAATRGSMATYREFRRSFLAGYAGASGSLLQDETLDRFIDLRIKALAGWLDDLDSAPIGIRSATPSWQAALRSFVTAHRPGVV